MATFGESPDTSPLFLVKGYPWSSLGHGTIVDVGGSTGSISIAIAEAHPALQFIVQDRPEVIKETRGIELPDNVATRVTFAAHDFFTPQTVIGDVYLFRYIFHNWPDAYVVDILRQLVVALRPGSRVVINDTLLPEPNTASITAEREVR